uniref:Uncharacterized protein n=1 Tax=Anguilla anguilla TaxID=7936 RepID=A0A0E9P6J2_ANGAN
MDLNSVCTETYTISTLCQELMVSILFSELVFSFFFLRRGALS